MTTIQELIARWNSDEGKPFKGLLIDLNAYEADPENIGCMCAQGQVLHVFGGWGPQRLYDTEQSEADLETAKLLNISRAHAVLLRNVNDSQGGAPSIVLAEPEKVLGNQWSKLLDFWWALDQFDAASWYAAQIAAQIAAGDAASWYAARAAAQIAAGDAASWYAARAAAGDAAVEAVVEAASWYAARAAAGDAAGDAVVEAAGEIQGFSVLTQRGQDVFFLPMFGWVSPADIPARPANYGLGVVPVA